MKKIKVIAIELQAAEKYVENLKFFFGDLFHVEGISLKNNNITEKVDGDLIVVSNQVIYHYVRSLIPEDSEVVYLDFSFYKSNIEILKNIPIGTRVLLVDYKEYTAISLAAFLNEYGIRKIHLLPYAPEIEFGNISDIDIAITPGLVNLVPNDIKKVYDIGYRKIDVSSITTIASKLGVPSVYLDKKIIKYSDVLVHKNHGMTDILKSLKKDQIHINAILESIDDGIIITDKNNSIIHCSRHICNLLKMKDCNYKFNQTALEPICSELLKMSPVENKFISIDKLEKNLIVTKRSLNVLPGTENSIIIVKDAEKIQNMEIGIRKKLAKKGYLAKYSFKDIIYRSEKMHKTIERAKKISMVDTTTLIIGDTGTGKELMAHSIHNNSIRKNNPFLAINCAALTDNLLESELFGYEEGAFTGAKKGGKKGLFELAHNGTLFLDELSSISQLMQVKLLRVLQEKEVMRIGGTNIIPINVRIIAATNVILEELIEKGRFRKDLYYRINNFTIELPQLKDRKEDIPIIIDSIFSQHNCKKKISTELMSFLINYEWPGNIRELRNCIEYMILMGENILTLDDLPSYMRYVLPNNCNDKKEILPALFDDEKEIVSKILEIISIRSMGRRNLYKMLIEMGYDITEYKLRKIINYLRKQNIISVGKGRSGIRPMA
ncbi:sigma-54 interaction domain-containing protein [Wukongibacter sp. M2B1]|uniref:sigma-54 interaction domain-containing protein n=1 Tax=Wukongibacter sp. M2B1 TaxID=3088895 RepID=UPI003D7A2C62